MTSRSKSPRQGVKTAGSKLSLLGNLMEQDVKPAGTVREVTENMYRKIDNVLNTIHLDESGNERMGDIDEALIRKQLESVEQVEEEDHESLGYVLGKIGSLSPCESQCLSAVLEDSFDQMKILEHVKLDYRNMEDANRQALQFAFQSASKETSLLSPEDAANLQAQNILEKKYTQAKIAKTSVRVKKETLSCIAKELRENTRQLINNISKSNSKQKPGYVIKLGKDRTFTLELIKKTLSELQTSGRYDSLVQALHSEKARKKSVEDIIVKKGAILAKLKNFGRELQGEARLREEEVAYRNDVIAMLKDQLQEIRSRTSIEGEYIKREIKARSQGKKNQALLRLEDYANRTELLHKQIEREQLATEQIEKYLEVDIARLLELQQDWIEKYEQDLAKKIEEIETLKRHKSHQLQTICDESENYTDMDAKITQYYQEKEVEMKIKQERAYKERCIIRIQAWARRG